VEDELVTDFEMRERMEITRMLSDYRFVPTHGVHVIA
jgi:hypothetical protein